MFDSSSLDKALHMAFSFASASLAAAVGAVQWLSFLTGVKPEVIFAGGAGLIAFTLMLALIVPFGARSRREVLTAWPSQRFSQNTPAEAPIYATASTRIFEAPQQVQKERFELTDPLGERLQERFTEASFGPTTNVPEYGQDNSSQRGRPVFASVMKVTGELLSGATTQVTAFIHHTVSRVHAWHSSRSKARASSQCSSGCDWNRVARDGWRDDVRSFFGWYPWQCQQCQRCSYFRRRT